jgi:hypothetical protein
MPLETLPSLAKKPSGFGVTSAVLFCVLALGLQLGCLGVGDVFSARARVAGSFYLEHMEDDNIYLMRDGESTTISPPVTRIAWNQEYIFVSSFNPQEWQVYSIRDSRIAGVDESARAKEKYLDRLSIQSAKELIKQH